MNYLNRSVLLLTTLLFLSISVHAMEIPKDMQALPVQYHGRVMPFNSFARELILGVAGRQHLKGEKSEETVMRWMAHPELASSEPVFDVGYEPLRKEVGLPASRMKFSLDELLAIRKIQQLAMESSRIKSQEGKPTRIQSEAEKVLNNMGNLYGLITNQAPGMIPVANDPYGQWLPINGALEDADEIGKGIQMGLVGMLSAYADGDAASLSKLAAETGNLMLQRWNPGEERLNRFTTEVNYNSQRPIQRGRDMYMVGLILLLFALIGWANKLVPISAIIIWIGFAAHVYGLALRSIIGDRAPWSNFYESLVSLTGVMVLLGLIFAKGKLRGIILASTAMAGFFSLLIADRAGLSPGVETLVPALQSYWLTIHVIVILAGYAAAALAMVIGHFSLGIEAFKPNDRSLFVASTNAVYRAVQMAMLLLFAGTILGGVWAHEAWGRYWGWDPKETWALISWFGYLGVAHARYAGWLKPRGIALAAIAVFPLILMTYYGVNYLLSGLHSYAGGESAAIPPLLIGFLAFEAFVVYAGVKGWHLKLSPKGGDAQPPTKPTRKPKQAAEPVA